MDPQLAWCLALAAYVLLVLRLSKLPHDRMVARGMEPIRAVYYTRKIVHMAGSGLPSLFVPVVFEDFWYPTVGGLVLGVLLHAAHATGRRMFWFQTEDNRNDVTFAFMWWVSLSALWWILRDPWLAILPALFMSFGDGVTGVVRNALIRRRSKHPIGNLFMLLVCVPMGGLLASWAAPPLTFWGALAGAVATGVERYELGPIDDNILIAVASTAVLLVGSAIGPV